MRSKAHMSLMIARLIASTQPRLLSAIDFADPPPTEKPKHDPERIAAAEAKRARKAAKRLRDHR